jgi:hypothetical protein
VDTNVSTFTKEVIYFKSKGGGIVLLEALIRTWQTTKRYNPDEHSMYDLQGGEIPRYHVSLVSL